MSKGSGSGKGLDSKSVVQEYEALFNSIMGSKDDNSIKFMLGFHDWINTFMKQASDNNEKTFLFRSVFAIAKRLLNSKLDGNRLSKTGEIISTLRSLHEEKDALFIAEYLKLQLFEDCKLDSETPDWGLVDKYLDHWAEASKEEEIPIIYYKRDEKGEIIDDRERINVAGPLFFRHCSAECVEWFYGMELKPIDYTSSSLRELDRVLDTYWPKEHFKDTTIEDEEDPYSTVLLRLILMTGSYLGEVLVRSLGGKWEKLESDGWFIRLRDSGINVFTIAEESFRGISKFYNAFETAQARNKK